MPTKLHLCAGCRLPLSTTEGHLTCVFSRGGFRFHSGRWARPCQAQYHPGCIRAGPPFATRRSANQGLAFPLVSTWGTFVCEWCTVRAVLDRELRFKTDQTLLCLERMRLLDIAHSWSKGTHSSYQGKLRQVREFERAFRVSILRWATPSRPFSGFVIPLMWCQEAYSLRPASSRRARDDAIGVSYDAIRQIRSAVSQFYTWESVITNPAGGFVDAQRRLIQVPCRPTDAVGFTHHTRGMAARVGTKSRPSVALLDRHVRHLDAHLDTLFTQARTEAERRRCALAGLANLLLWLGWLRSSEVFSLCWSDVELTSPRDGPLVDLPPGCGMLALSLLPETKSSRTDSADVVVAYRTLSGLCVGRWFVRAFTLRPTTSDAALIFTDASGLPWDSHYYRLAYLYPSLHAQRASGDPFLRAFDGSPGNTIEDKFWSLHCYRRWARSHVSRGGLYGANRFRRASPDQVYMHGRWRLRRQNEPIDRIYQEWTTRERIKITLYSH